ncbi:MAG: ArsB/NhaD family transporter [Nitrososphaerales archaeon]
MIYLVLAIFIVTYGLLIFRKIRGRNIPVWVSMIVGAILMLVTLSISPLDAFYSIDFRVISFLFGMLVITAGFEKSGLIEYLVLALLRRAKSIDRMLLAIIFGAGFLSAILVNDTLALLVTPIVLSVASKLKLKQNKSLLLPLAFGITTGSTMSPIGNPQNLLVSLNSGMKAPFSEFLLYLFIPTVISLLAVYYVCRLFYKKDLAEAVGRHAEIREGLALPSSAVTDKNLASLSAGTLIALVIGFALIEIFPDLQSLGLSIYVLAFAAGVAILALSPRRVQIFLGINWGILIFFAGMFIVMRAVWDSRIGAIMLSSIPQPIATNRLQYTSSIMTSSALLSQVLSNVPFVQLYSYQMGVLGFTSTSVVAWLTLAAGSTLAGNLTLLGAVSNVIVIDAAQARGARSFSFFEFLKAGVVITLVTSAIFFVFLAFL